MLTLETNKTFSGIRYTCYYKLTEAKIGSQAIQMMDRIPNSGMFGTCYNLLPNKQIEIGIFCGEPLPYILLTHLETWVKGFLASISKQEPCRCICHFPPDLECLKDTPCCKAKGAK